MAKSACVAKKRRLAMTEPPTLTSREVAEVFLGGISTADLQYLDEQQYLRPSFYLSRSAPGSLISPPARDAIVRTTGRNRGNNRRRFTYGDMVWIQLLIYVKERLKLAGATLPLKRAGDIVRRLRGNGHDSCP